MEMVATYVLNDSHTIAEDVIALGRVIVEKDTKVTPKVIERLNDYSIMGVMCYEPSDFATSYYEKIRLSKEFSKWKTDYETMLVAYKVAVDSFVIKKIPFRESDLLNISSTLFTDKMTGKRLMTYINLMTPREDDLSYVHGLNVALMSKLFGRWLKWSAPDVDWLTLAGFIYDVGKHFLPQDIIWKPGKLSSMEYDLIKTHAFHAYHLLSKTNLDKRILNCVLQHHERCDGSGYPQGLKGPEIDDFAKVIAIVDVYEAMTAPRTYRSPMCPFKAIAILEQDVYQKYDIKYIHTFMQNLSDEMIGNHVRLNTGDVSVVIMTNRHYFSKPIIQMEDGTVIDLSKMPQFTLEEIV
ncbi:MAG: HD-GYP domain-containing protein [Lachnospiraceae bacterium]|nr:HD-GYP domain-containing protein [Lachnospiraceae bacterium]